MRNLFYPCIFCLCVFGNFLPHSVWAQLPPLQPEQDAPFAKPICQINTYEPLAYQGKGNMIDIDSTLSCLSLGERNGAWYLVNTLDTGDLCFTIIPDDPLGDFDFAVYDITHHNTPDILSDQSLEVSCNFTINLTTFGCQGRTGADGDVTGPCGLMHRPCISALPGSTYLIYVSNYSNPTGYTLDFSKSTTRITTTEAPKVSSYLSDATFRHIAVSFLTSIDCNSINISDFKVESPGQTHTIQQLEGGDCKIGGLHENEFQLTISPPLDPATLAQARLIITDTIIDKCGNILLSDTLPLTEDVDIQLLPDTPVCAGNPVELSTTFSNSSDYDHLWYPTNDTTSKLLVRPEATTEYQVLITDASGKIVGSATKQVLVKPSPLPMLGPDTAICGNSLTLRAGTFNSYLWSNLATNASIVANNSGLYWVEVSNNAGCSRRDSIRVSLYQTPQAQFAAQPTNLTVQFTNQSTPFETVIWDFGDGNMSDQLNPIHTYSVPGTYSVNMEIKNPCGTDQVMQQVEVMAISRDPHWPQNLDLYPNPTADFLTLQATAATFGQAHVSLMDAHGQKVRSGTLMPHQSLSWKVDDLPAGYYYCQVLTEQGMWSKVVIIEP